MEVIVVVVVVDCISSFSTVSFLVILDSLGVETVDGDVSQLYFDDTFQSWFNGRNGQIL